MEFAVTLYCVSKKVAFRKRAKNNTAKSVQSDTARVCNDTDPRFRTSSLSSTSSSSIPLLTRPVLYARGRPRKFEGRSFLNFF